MKMGHPVAEHGLMCAMLVLARAVGALGQRWQCDCDPAPSPVPGV